MYQCVCCGRWAGTSPVVSSQKKLACPRCKGEVVPYINPLPSQGTGYRPRDIKRHKSMKVSTV